jgi:hypothetical protein
MVKINEQSFFYLEESEKRKAHSQKRKEKAERTIDYVKEG